MTNLDYERARKIVAAKFSFLIHLVVYICVNALLVIINLNTAPEKIWFIWPMMGWGIGLLIHGVAVFLAPRLSDLMERMTEKEMIRQKKNGRQK